MKNEQTIRQRTINDLNELGALNENFIKGWKPGYRFNNEVEDLKIIEFFSGDRRGHFKAIEYTEGMEYLSINDFLKSKDLLNQEYIKAADDFIEEHTRAHYSEEPYIQATNFFSYTLSFYQSRGIEVFKINDGTERQIKSIEIEDLKIICKYILLTEGLRNGWTFFKPNQLKERFYEFLHREEVFDIFLLTQGVFTYGTNQRSLKWTERKPTKNEWAKHGVYSKASAANRDIVAITAKWILMDQPDYICSKNIVSKREEALNELLESI